MNVEDVHKHNINTETRDMWIHGVMTEGEYEPGIDWRSATTAVKNILLLNALGQEPFTIHLHTCGGDVEQGMAIYDTIRAVRNDVTIIGYSEVRSMSSIIFLAGDKKYLMPSAKYMIHKGYFGMEDYATLVYTNVEESKRFDEWMLDLYAEYSDFTVRELEDMMDKKGDVFFTAEEAYFHGFSDGIWGEFK